MVQSKLFSLKSLETEVWSSLHNSINEFDPSASADFWAKTSLREKAENALANIAKNNEFTSISSDSPIDPPNNGNGFRATFGLQLSIGYKVSVRATANIGTGFRTGNFGMTNSLHFAAYNSGLGVGANGKKFVVDITAALNLTVGGGQGVPLQSYATNYNSPIPNLNTFQNSFSYGQLLTWNSNINKDRFSLDDLHRQGMIGFRLGDVNVSSNNDTKLFYFGDGNDMSWTGGISIATPIFEVGFQDFSGDYIHNAPIEEEREELKRKIKEIKKDDSINKEEKKSLIKEISEKLIDLTDNNLHTQTDYQKNLNKASTYFRINNNNGYNATIDLIGPAWFQNVIHRGIKDLRFEYKHKEIELWGGKSW